jgi:hypothetical protein
MTAEGQRLHMGAFVEKNMPPALQLQDLCGSTFGSENAPAQ